MAIQTLKKMTKQKREFYALKMGTKWNLSQHQIDTRAIGVEESMSSGKVKSRNLGLKDSDSPYKLRMVGRKVLVEEEPMEATHDNASGLTKDVVEAIKNGKLVLSDQSEYALMKFPFRGTVLSVGEKCKYTKAGDRIHFAPLGVQRFEFRGKQFLVMHEEDIHGFYETKPR